MKEIKIIKFKNEHLLMNIIYIIDVYKNDKHYSKKRKLFKIFTYFFNFMYYFCIYKKLILYKNIKKILKKVKGI